MILLVNSKIGEDSALNVKDKEFMHPYSLVYLSNFLIKHGYNVNIYDFYMNNNYSFENLLKSENPKIIGFTAVAQSRFIVTNLATIARKLCPNACIVVGGSFFSYNDKQTLEIVPSDR